MIFDRFLASPEVMQVLDERAFVQAMLDFEAALARAQAAAGAIPAGAGEVIASACDASGFDVDAIAIEGGRVGTIAIPLVKALTAEVAKLDADAALVVHWGSTTQDVLDTAQVLVTRNALALIDRDLSVLIPALLKLADTHGESPLLGRTLMQPAQVTSFAFKLAGWIAPLVRAQARLRAPRRCNCSWVALSARARCSDRTATPSRPAWRVCWACAIHRWPGTRSATSWLHWAASWACWLARWARSARTSR